jgi:hypothetical protein
MSTSRLKRKAEDNDLLQDNNLNESFVQYGTALPSLASTKKDQGEYVPVWKQVSGAFEAQGVARKLTKNLASWNVGCA